MSIQPSYNLQSKDSTSTNIIPMRQAALDSQKNSQIDRVEPRRNGDFFKNIRTWIASTLGLKNNDGNLRETLEQLAEESESAELVVTAEGKSMLHNILSFFELKVSDIMVPRVNIIAVEEKIGLDELKRVIRENEHTRMPVYRNNMDEIVGFIHIKDLIRYTESDADFSLQNFVREIVVVPASMRVLDLLVKMRLSGVHIAVVVDEFGGTDGLVTLEDIFEEIVGDIQDEHDELEENQKIIKIADNLFEADARLEMENLEKFLGFTLDEQEDEREYDTVGGFIFELLGRVPAVGEVIEAPHNINFEILDADSRRILRVRMTLKEHQDA